MQTTSVATDIALPQPIAVRYRPEVSAPNAAGLWQVRDLRTGLRRWLRHLGDGETAAAARSRAEAAHRRLEAKPFALGLAASDEADGEHFIVLRYLGEVPLALPAIAGAGLAVQLVEAIHDLQTAPVALALPELAVSQLVILPSAQRLRMTDLSAVVLQPDAAVLAAGRSSARRVLDDLLSSHISSSERYAELASAWENDEAAYPELRLALTQLQLGQLLAQA